MPTTTGAVLRSAESNYSIQELTIEEPRLDEVLVKLTATGMCHTDLSVRDPFRPTPYPVVLGHEGAGVIEAVGAGITDLAVGQPVVLSFSSCARCRPCLTGDAAYCASLFALNFSCCRPDGTTSLADSSGPIGSHFFGQSSFAKHAIAPRSSVVPVPDDAPLRLLGPLGCGVQTGAGAVLNVLQPSAGDSMVVFGCGAVGLSAVMAAGIAGCKQIIGVDLHENRLEFATNLGATHVLDGGRSDLVEALVELTGGGASHSLDSAGGPDTLEKAVACLAQRGTAGFVAAGGPDHKASFRTRHLLTGRTVTGIIEGSSVPAVFIPELVELHRQGRFPFDELLTFFPLDQINEAEAASMSGEVIKPVLTMD